MQSLTTIKQQSATTYSQEFLENINKIGDAIVAKHREIQQQETPKSKIHKIGKKKKKVKWEDLEYVKEDYMKEQLNKYFKGLWSWVAVGNGSNVYERIGQVTYNGTLKIMDEGILREFSACGASPIKIKSGQSPNYDTIINLDNDVKAANTQAFKKAINMLTNICDDVYGKDIEVTTDPVLHKQLVFWYDKIESKEEKDEIAKYVGSEFSDWEHIPDENAKTMIINMKKIVERKDVQEKLKQNYQQATNKTK